MRLRLEEAYNSLTELKRRDPHNDISLLLENYADCLAVLLNDRHDDYRRCKKNSEKRLRRLERSDWYSPYCRYVQAEILLQNALLAGRFNDWLTALSDVKQAYALLEENRRYYPDFLPNLKSLGILHALVGNVPDEYRWMLRLAGGIDGSIDSGMNELETVLTYAEQHDDFPFHDETRAAYAYLQLYLHNQPEAAWKTMQHPSFETTDNPLNAFARANLAHRVGKTDEAIRLLETAQGGPPYAVFHYRYFLLGVAKLYRLDADANVPLQQFVHYFPGNNGMKEAYQKLAWHHLVQGNDAGYRAYMGYVQLKGAARTEPDKAAQREAERGQIPDARLLRARLLFDGGYYQQAYQLLQPAAADYAAPPLRLEYIYRLGRVAHQLGKTDEAERLYRQTIAEGQTNPAFFACNAALQLGLLYETRGDFARARRAFQKCLTLKPEEYAGSLHGRAKAGLQRVEGK